MLRGAFALLLAGCGFSTSIDVQNNPDGAKPPDGGGTTTDAPGMTTDAPPPMPITRRIDVNGAKVIGGPHTDFPLLITATINAAHPNAFDVYFSTDMGGVTRLAHEIESYAGGQLVAWVKVPLLASAGTTFYLHYGNTTITTSQENRPAVWSANFAAVWHLANLDDSTTLNNGTNSGATSAGGKIASAHAFDGSDDIVNAGSNGSIDNIFTGGGTVETWFIATSWGENDLGRIFDKGPSNISYAMCNANVSGAFLFGKTFNNGAGNWCTPQNSIALNQWTHVAVAYDDGSSANVPTIYINGVAQTVTPTSNPSGTTTSDAAAALTIGDRTTGSRAFAGRIDEARWSTTTRSAGWIQTSYENQRDPSMTVTIAPPP